MRVLRPVLATLAICALAAVATAPLASADVAGDAATALQSSSLYVADPAAVISDKSGVEAALPTWMKVAVLPAGAGSASQLATDIGGDLDPTGSKHLVVAVVAGRTFGAGSSAYCAGYAESQATAAVSDNETQLKAGGDHPDLTALIEDFAKRAATGPLVHTAACDGGAGATQTTPASASGATNSAGSVWPWLIGIVAVIALLLGGVSFYQRGQRRRRLAEARANVEPYYDRLAAELNSLDPKDNAVARQALSDASERFTSAGSQLQGADSVQRYLLARRTVLEGLYATSTARTALGLDPGPPLPPIYEGPEQQLTESQTVTVRGQNYQGYPSYTPGAPYYFGGGVGVPGGWYATPFWETLLLGSVLTGGFGGFGGGWGGGGYGAGYDAGYQAGDDAGTNAAGDWGAGGGGDWGSGGGGGDWGGGGGDFGGGGGDAGGSW
jgi:hypothetical protein